MSVVVAVVLFVFFVVIVGKASGRLLGIRLGNWRGVLVGTMGWMAGLVATSFVIGEQTSGGGHTIEVSGLEDALGTGALIVFFGVLAAMPLAIGVDLLTRSAPRGRSRRGRWWLHPVGSLQSALAPYGRLREVIGHARHANLLHLRYATGAALDSPDLARRVRAVLEESGGMMVKLGQIASTRTDVLPAPLTAELSRLRAATCGPSEPDDVRAVIEAELGEPVEQAFASFEWEPLAAASIGQTHRAVLHDGARVVVKVRRPGIEDVVARDCGGPAHDRATAGAPGRGGAGVGRGGLTEELIGGLRRSWSSCTRREVGNRTLRSRTAPGRGGSRAPQVLRELSTAGCSPWSRSSGGSVGEPAALDVSPCRRGRVRAARAGVLFRAAPRDAAFPRRSAPGQHADRSPTARSWLSTSARWGDSMPAR